MNGIALVFLLVASPLAAFDLASSSDLAPFLQKKIPSDPEAPVPVVVPVNPKTPFPEIPPVEAMLNTSSNTVHEIVDEVTKMEQRVHSIEKQDKMRLAEKKAEFDASLKTQDEETRDVIDENAEIAGRIVALHKSNQGLRNTTKELIAENQQMREELRAAAGKVAASEQFIKTSQKSTDDRHSKALAVLSEGSKVHRRQNPVPVSEEDSEDATESQEPAQNEDATSGDAVDSAPKDSGSEDKPKGLVSVFRHRSKISGQAKHQAKDNEKKEDDDKDDDDKDDDSKDDDKDDDKDDEKDDSAESFMQFLSRRSEESMDMDMESEESDSEEAHSSNNDPIFVHPGRGHGVHHKNREFSENIAVDGASKNMLSVVSHELKDLAEEDEQGLERQAQIFHSELSQEHHAYKAALAQQRALNKTEASLLALQSKLRRAVSHLQTTKGHLQQRLKGLGQYLQHLAHLLLAPDQSAAYLIGDMPQEVPIPAVVPVQSAPVTSVQSAPAAQPAATSVTSATLSASAPVVKR